MDLVDVSAYSGTDAWAVGMSTPETPATAPSSPIAYHWKGYRWKVVPTDTADGRLYGVADLGPDDAWAVGEQANPQNPVGDGALIEHWNGEVWTAVPSPRSAPGPGGRPSYVLDLREVSAVSADDIWAVGEGDSDTLGAFDGVTEHWDGSSWSIVEVSRLVTDPTSLHAFGPSDVWEAGGDVLAHFDGSTWQTILSDGFLFGASSSTNVWAEGYSGQLNLQRWDGLAWNPEPMPFEAVVSIATVSPTDTWVIGGPSSGKVVKFAHWDGTGWMKWGPSALIPTLPNRRPEAVTTIPGTSSAWIVGYSGGSLLHPMFLLAHCGATDFLTASVSVASTESAFARS